MSDLFESSRRTEQKRGETRKESQKQHDEDTRKQETKRRELKYKDERRRREEAALAEDEEQARVLRDIEQKACAREREREKNVIKIAAEHRRLAESVGLVHFCLNRITAPCWKFLALKYKNVARERCQRLEKCGN